MAFEVPTNVLLEQGRATLGLLEADDTLRGRQALTSIRFDVTGFIDNLRGAIAEGEVAEAEQERAKALVTREHQEDRSLAEAGFRWILRLQARVRRYLVASKKASDAEDLRGVFRFGKLRRARARGVLYELRILIPEAEEQQQTLAPFGLDEAFIEEGRNLLVALGAERSETTAAIAKRNQLTRKVQAAEERLSSLLSQLEQADHTAALETPDARRWFPLDVIASEVGRVNAAREAREAARAPQDPGPDAKDDD